MIKAITVVDPPIIENIPGQLTERPQWVCWRLEDARQQADEGPLHAWHGTQSVFY